jgi:type I restriction enzyme S subunit
MGRSGKVGWQTKTLGELCQIERGGSPRPIDSYLTTNEDGINWIKIGDTKGITKYITTTEEKIRPEGAKRSRMVFEGDFVLSNSMSFGRPYIMRTTGCIHDGWLVLRQPKVNQDYLYHVLGSDLVFSQFDRLAAGSTVRNLNIGLVQGVQIPVPPLPEQKRIVGILDEAFEGIATAKANAEKNLQNARALFESHLQSVFTQRGPGWMEKKLSEVCAITSTLVDPRKTEFLDLIHVGAGNIESQTGTFVGLKTAREEGLISGKFLFDESMVLYSKIRPYLMKAARPSFNGLCSADMYPLAPVPNEIARDYLFHLLLSKRFTDYAIAGSARAGMPKVNREHLFEFKVWLPAVKEQRKLAAELDGFHERTQRLASIYQQKLAALEALKKSLLHQAFSGEL